MNSTSYEYRKMSTRRGALFVPIGMQTVWWKTLSQNHEHIVNYLDDVIVRVFAFRIGVLPHKICFIVLQYQIFVSTVTVFEMKAFRIIQVSL